MSMKPLNAGIWIALCGMLTLHPFQVFPATKKAVKQMGFYEFVENVKGKGPFEITVTGTARVSHFTGKKYIHYETVAYFGLEDVKSTHQILYHTQEDFTIIHGAIAVPVHYSQIRTCLNPSFEEKYTKVSLADPRSEKEQSLRSILDGGDAAAVLLVEYGLEAGKKYYCRLKTESYRLPPQERGGKPQRKEKTVLVISDQPFPNTIEPTPLYKGWSY